MLSDAKVRAAKPRAKPYKLTDTNRLYLLVTPGGGKLWRWNYYFDGKQKSLALGVYPMVSLENARIKRDEAYAAHIEGLDPAIAKRLRIHANQEAARQTFEKLARAWHANAAPQWAARHADDVIRSLERDVFPSIGDLPVSGITPPLVLGTLREIESRGSIETARRIRQRISAAFVYGIAAGFIESDPAEKLGAVLKPLRRGRQAAITELKPLQIMIGAAEEDYARPLSRLALRLLALTAIRPNELRGAWWAEFEGLKRRPPGPARASIDCRAARSLAADGRQRPCFPEHPACTPPDEREHARLSIEPCRLSRPTCPPRVSRRFLHHHE